MPLSSAASAMGGCALPTAVGTPALAPRANRTVPQALYSGGPPLSSSLCPRAPPQGGLSLSLFPAPYCRSLSRSSLPLSSTAPLESRSGTGTPSPGVGQLPLVCAERKLAVGATQVSAPEAEVAGSPRDTQEEGRGGGYPLVSGTPEGSPGASLSKGGKGGKGRHRVVVLGSGWGGMSVARSLDTSLYDVTMVSPRNYFLFTPLLPGVTTGLVEARSLAEPIRRIMEGREGFTFLEAECEDIDPSTKTLTCRAPAPLLPTTSPTTATATIATGTSAPTPSPAAPSSPPAEGDTTAMAAPGDADSGLGGTFQVSYDSLILAVGARPNTFGIPGVAQHCLFLKELDDALAIRERILGAFEGASLPLMEDAEVRRRLHFVIVGGGPTGVEFSAELFDLIQDDLSRFYPALVPLARITILEAVDHILNMFDKRVSDFAEQKFRRQGVNLLTGKRVVEVREQEIVLCDRRTEECSVLEYGTAVWSTGIGTRPVLARFMAKVGQWDRRAVGTDEWLRVQGTRDVWAIGDCSTVVQRPLADDVLPLFKLADKDGDGVLEREEFQNVLRTIKGRYPQISLYLRRRTLRQVLKDVYSPESDAEDGESGAAWKMVAEGAEGGTEKAEKGGGGGGGGKSKSAISIDEFGAALKQVDAQLKGLPATAQVAAQQGEYLGRCFNQGADPSFRPQGPPRTRGEGRHRFKPFRVFEVEACTRGEGRHRFKPFGYMHLGQFAPLGGGQAGVQLPGDIISVGSSSQWLWYSVYTVKQVSWRTRALVVFDWVKGALFGRDLSSTKS